MAAYIKAADVLKETFHCLVLIIHHCGLNEERPRGHTSLVGAADVQISVKRDADNNIIAEVEWMRDGPEGATVVGRLETVPLGMDDDGEHINSCVIVPVEGAVVNNLKSAEPNEGPHRVKLLRAIQKEPGKRQVDLSTLTKISKDRVSKVIKEPIKTKLISERIEGGYEILDKGEAELQRPTSEERSNRTKMRRFKLAKLKAVGGNF